MKIPGTAHPETARVVLYFLGALATATALLFFLSLSWQGAVIFVAATPVLLWGARHTPPIASSKEWGGSDVAIALSASAVLVVWVGSLGSALGSSPTANAIQGGLVYGGAALGIFVAFGMRKPVPWHGLGLRFPHWKWYVAVPIAFGVGIALTTVVLNLETSSALFQNQQNTQCTTVRQEFGTSVWVAIPIVCVVAPIVEETLFRGLIYGWLRTLFTPLASASALSRVGLRALPLLAAMVISGVVFGASHVPQGALLFLPLALFGMLLAALYEFSGSLVPGMLVHGLFNLLGIFSILFANSC